MFHKRVLTLAACSLFFISFFLNFSYASQSIFIPYGTVAGDYWTGLAIHNKSKSTAIYTVSFYNSNGSLIGSNAASPIILAGNAQKVDIVQNYISNSITGRFSLRIDSSINEQFEATMFMGNNGNSNEGFSFQTYESKNPNGMCILCNGTYVGTRWCDNGNGTVTDTITGLVWLKKADWGGSRAWRETGDASQNDDAHTRAGLLEHGASRADLTDGSVEGDWRIPTKTELVTLGSGPEGVSPTNMRAFTGVSTGDYWSSTSSTWPSTASAIFVNLDSAPPHVGVGTKSSTRAVWPVRGMK